MANEETNKLNLITEKIIDASFLGKTIIASSGFSIEIFQENQYRGSIRLPLDNAGLSLESPISVPQLKIRNRSTQLTINLGPQLLKLQGDLYTKDQYTANYEVSVEIRVNNPMLFAQRYLQKSDPVGLLRSAIVQDFDYYAIDTSHDELSSVKLRHDIRYNAQSAKMGLSIGEIYKSTIYADPRRASIRTMEQNAEVEKATNTINFEITSLRENHDSKLTDQREENIRKRQAKGNQFERDEHKKDRNALIQEQVQEKLVEKYVNHLVSQVDMDIDIGTPFDEMVEKYPMLGEIVLPLLQSDRLTELAQNSKQLEDEREIKQESTGLPSSTPPETQNAPKMPIPESDAAVFREIENEDEE